MGQARALPRGILSGLNAGGSAIGAGLGVKKSTTGADVVSLPAAVEDAGFGVTLEEIPALGVAAGSIQTEGRAVAKAGGTFARDTEVECGTDGRFVTRTTGRAWGRSNTAGVADAEFELDLYGPGGSAEPAEGAILFRELTIGHAALDAAAVAQTLNLAAILPADVDIVGVACSDYTPFSGGTVSALVADIGSAGDPDAIKDGINLFAAAVDGQPSTAPDGIAPNKHFEAATQLTITFTATGDNLVNLTAGSVKVRVYFRSAA